MLTQAQKAVRFLIDCCIEHWLCEVICVKKCQVICKCLLQTLKTHPWYNAGEGGLNQSQVRAAVTVVVAVEVVVIVIVTFNQIDGKEKLLNVSTTSKKILTVF